MNYDNLKIKSKFIGKTIFDNNKSYILSNDLSANDKKYIYNLITKSVFDIYIDELDKIVEIHISEPVTEKEVKVIEVKTAKPKVTKPRKPKAKTVKK